MNELDKIIEAIKKAGKHDALMWEGMKGGLTHGWERAARLLLKENEKAMKILRHINAKGEWNHNCVVCGGDSTDHEDSVSWEHKPDCRLDEFLKTGKFSPWWY